MSEPSVSTGASTPLSAESHGSLGINYLTAYLLSPNAEKNIFKDASSTAFIPFSEVFLSTGDGIDQAQQDLR